MVRLVLAAVVIDAAFVYLLWNQYDDLDRGPIPVSEFMRSYVRAQGDDPALPLLRWQPLPMEHMPPQVVQAVLIGEDDRFFSHSGFDLIEIRAALTASWERRRLSRGASTISQQTAKNLFLSPERSVLRKWHELLLTVVLETALPKRRILEIYLNVAEFGVGIYGVDAAARTYWGQPVSTLSLRQVAELAASLPAPRAGNPARRGEGFDVRSSRIYQRLRQRL